MEYPVIELKSRTSTGKMANKALRKSGEVPTVLYSKDGKSFMGSIPLVEARKLVADYSFMTKLFKVRLDKKDHLCIAREVQFNPVTDLPDHFDFKVVELKDKIVVSVPTVVVGKENSVGLKRGGNVFVTSYNVKLESLVSSIPNKIEVDISDSIIGSKYYLSDLKIENAKPLYSCLVARVSGRQKKGVQGQAEGAAEQRPAEAAKKPA